MKTLLALFLAVALTAFGQSGSGTSTVGVMDTVTSTNGSSVVYVGTAIATTAKPQPSTNAAVWRILRTTYSTNGQVTAWAWAYSTNGGDLALTSTAWTNRFNATYK